jgi:exodeoxyribonuclease VII large subunit
LVSESRYETRDTVRAMERQIREAMKTRLDRARLLIKPFNIEDLEYRFRAILQPRLVRFDDAKEALLEALADRVAELRRRLDLARTSLEAASPVSVLERGFSVVIHGNSGAVLRDAAAVNPGDPLIIRPLAGIINAITESVSLNTEEEES